VATLETAAEDLVRRITSLDGEVEAAKERLAKLKELVANQGQQIDQDWIELARQVGELIQKASEERGKLDQDSQQAQAALSQLEAGGKAAQSAFDSALEQAESDVKTFGDAIGDQEDPTEELIEQGVETPLEDLKTGAEEVADALEQAIEEARTFLEDDVAAGLSNLRDELEQRVDALNETLGGEECATALQEAFDDWAEKIDQVEELVNEQGFEAAREHAQEVVDWALGECADAHEEELDRLGDVVEVVEEALNELKSDVGECQTDVGEEGRSALEDAMNETSQALANMTATLDAVKAFLARYTFVEL